MTNTAAADLHALETKLADCATRLATARNDADKAHQIADLETEHELLVGRWVKLSGELGRLAA